MDAERRRRLVQTVGGRALLLTACAGLLLAWSSVLAPAVGWASRYTPAEWRRRIPVSPKTDFSGQLKHRGWSRDLDSNFVDDRIPAGVDPVHVVVELNDCYPLDQMRTLLGRYGRIDYLGELVSCVYLSRVHRVALDSLARLPEVAMVVWAAPIRPKMGVSVPAVQAAPSSTYGTEYVRANVGGKWTDPTGGAATTGLGVNIAIVDTGVRDAHSTLPGKDSSAGPVVAGYDATISRDPNEAGSDPVAWGPLVGHGSRVASLALGRGKSGVNCGKDSSDPTVPDCAGVAPEAGLVDVKVVTSNLSDTAAKELFATGSDFMRGLDWIALHKDEYEIAVVNISLSDGVDCDGTCPACEAVNELSSLGVAIVAGLGNRNDDDTADVIRRVPSPAAASAAITVGGTDDLRSVNRSGDTTFAGHLIGPRYVGGVEDTDPAGQKPDLAAPSRNIVSLGLPESPLALPGDDAYSAESGTSFSAPLAAGAAALLLQADPSLTPDAVKDILRRTADHTVVTSGATGWDATFGMGTLNVYSALHLARQTDLRFASCVGLAASEGTPCPLEDSPDWLNLNDLKTNPDPPRNGVPCTITAAITNDGSVDATNFSVAFGYYDFGTGSTLFHEIDTKLVDRLAAGATADVTCEWTPIIEGHQCLQATIIYGPDTELKNNTTQRNVTVEASSYDIRIDNPYLVPAQFYIRTKIDRSEWTFTVNQSEFMMGGPEDCAVHLQARFVAPLHALVGSRARCDISVFAKPRGSRDSTLIGGVTVYSVVPKVCRVSGVLVGEDQRPLRNVALNFERDVPSALVRADWERDLQAVTDSTGAFEIELPAGAHKHLRISAPGLPTWTIPFESRCGDGRFQIEVRPEGARLIR